MLSAVLILCIVGFIFNVIGIGMQVQEIKNDFSKILERLEGRISNLTGMVKNPKDHGVNDKLLRDATPEDLSSE